MFNSIAHESRNPSSIASASSTLSNNQGLSTDQRQNFKVVIRVRPPLPREIDPVYGFSSIISISPDHKRITILQYLGAADNDMQRQQDILQNPGLVTYHNFTFDYVYDQNSTQVQVYQRTARSSVQSILQGYNATVLAYGQTGTGKTFTMQGFKYNSTDPQRGISPRASQEIFKYIQSSQNANTTFMVRASYLQIYNQVISDLLKNDRSTLQIREQRRRGVFVQGLSEWAVRSPADIFSLMQKGQQTRATASTKMNDVSSRSHAVFIIILEQMKTIDMDQEGKEIKVGKLNFVDLAGSERVRVTGATGMRLQESKKINQSLSALGNVISALTDLRTRTHIPYRDSKLTRLLEDSLGGNCKTTMMAMVTPSNQAFGESLSSLKFANRAKNIKNAPKINQDVDQKTLLRKYEIQLRKLRSELEAKNKTMLDMQRLIQHQEQKRRQQTDPAFQMRSKEFLSEKDQTRRLQQKIKLMNSQLLVGGKKLEQTPQFITALQQRQKVIRRQYEGKLQQIERERQQIQEDKAQIDRYKQLLLRQRDIMIALTARLNQRDQTIIQLQEQLDAYDKLHRDTQQKLQYKTARCHQLQSILRNNRVPVPTDQTPDTNYFKEPKRYPPYSTDTVSLDNESFVPLQMLTAQQKIFQLSQIVENQKGEIKRLITGMNGSKSMQSRVRDQNMENVVTNNQQLNKEKRQLVSFLQNQVLGCVEFLYDGVNSNNFSAGNVLDQLQKLYDMVFEAANAGPALPPPEPVKASPSKPTRRPLTLSPSIKPLPSDLPDKILELQMQVELDNSIQALRQLLQLYTVISNQHAIEFYESKGDKKFKYYHERMMQVLQNQDSKLKKEQNPFQVSEKGATRAVDNLMMKNTRNVQSASKKLQKNIQSQYASLRSRLSIRNSVRRNRSLSPAAPLGVINTLNSSMAITSKEKIEKMRRSLQGESDRSGGLPRLSAIDEFQSELEELMEKFVLEKLKRVQEIRKKYSDQKEEMKIMGESSIIESVFEQMDIDMEAEIKQTQSELDMRRKTEIKALKNKIAGDCTQVMANNK